MTVARLVVLAAVASTASALVPPVRRPTGASTSARRRDASLAAGFGAASTKKKKAFVSAGKKDLEKQWESFVLTQRKGSRLFSCQSVWARADADGEWLRVGAVVTTSDEVSNSAAVAAQKQLISWTAAELHPTLNKKSLNLEFGLGPYVDDDAEEKADADASKVAPVEKAKSADAKAVGFKPQRSPLTEHQTSLGGALLNKSIGKGSAKFKKMATPEGAADSKGNL